MEFEERFSSEEACYAYLAEQRWRVGFCCPRCGRGQAWRLARRRLLECKNCGHQASVTAGTVFHRTRRPLRLWFRAMLLMACQHSGISARSLRRQLGLGSYQTAWTWLHKLRRAMVLKRWLLGTHQGGVQPWRLPAYLDEFVFRYNRRTSRSMTLPFQRLCALLPD